MESVTLKRLSSILQKRLYRRFGTGATAIRCVTGSAGNGHTPDHIFITSELPNVDMQTTLQILGEVRAKYKADGKWGAVVIIRLYGGSYDTITL